MPDDGSAQSTTVWPLPKFYFKVKIGSDEMVFQEVSGLDAETQVIEYRSGNSPTFSVVKMPGLKKFSDVTLKKGVFKSDAKIWDRFNAIKMNTIKREAITISLLDEAGGETMIWKLTNAFPIKVQGTDLKSTGNEVAVETMVLAHEGLTVENK
jgi:phage tail-like protein